MAVGEDACEQFESPALSNVLLPESRDENLTPRCGKWLQSIVAYWVWVMHQIRILGVTHHI